MGERRDQVDIEIYDKDVYLILIKLVLLLYAIGFIYQSYDNKLKKTYQYRMIRKFIEKFDKLESAEAKMKWIFDICELIIVDNKQNVNKYYMDGTLPAQQWTRIESTRSNGVEGWVYKKVQSYVSQDGTIDYDTLMDQTNFMMKYYGRKYGLEWGSAGRSFAEKEKIRLFEYKDLDAERDFERLFELER